MPPPDVPGGGGKPREWLWVRIRPWLERNFKRVLPERPPHARVRDAELNEPLNEPE
jgi:hypothetical protein